MKNRKIIVAITGASGAIYAVKLLERLRKLPESRSGLAGPPELHGLPGSPELSGLHGLTDSHGQARLHKLPGLHGLADSPGLPESPEQSGLHELTGLPESPGPHESHRLDKSPELHGQGMQSHGQTNPSHPLQEPLAEVAVILTENAEEIMLYETGAGYTPSGNEKLWSNNDFNAPFASGSSTYDTMIICPASMGMVGRIAHGVSDDLITRAADVMLKERRRLILVPRETPYSLIHITNMKLLTETGAVICPATPSFYSRPQTIDDLVMTVIDRVLTLAGFTIDTYRWNEQ